MLEPDGRLEFVQQDDGQTVAAHELALPEKVERICCCTGTNDLIVVVSGPVKDSTLLSAPPLIRPASRRPYINGLAHCFRRDNGEKVWTAPLGETVFPLDQPGELPVFVTVDHRLDESNGADADQNASATSKRGLRCFDRRTGKLLGEIESPGSKAPNYSLVGNREQLRIRLHTTERRMEIDFSAPNNEPPTGSRVRELAPDKPGN
jgi:outer membrane protein assembly factor BamB